MRKKQFLTYGPVPSRRLGRSLGINNIPSKICTYSCVYCQLGSTTRIKIERSPFYNPEEIFNQVSDRVTEVRAQNEKIDFLTFVPDGEPTLDMNLEEEIGLLKNLGIPIAVITNSSLLFLDDVRTSLLDADLVSIKVDSVTEKLWRTINHPSKKLTLNAVINGIKRFSEDFKGILISETMLIDNIEYKHEFVRIAQFLKSLQNLQKAYLAIPTRPPAVYWVKPPSEDLLNRAFQEFSKFLRPPNVEYLIGYEGDSFYGTTDVEKDLLSITSVHPMRKEAVEKLLFGKNVDIKLVDRLIQEKKMIKLIYEGEEYYMRKIASRNMSKTILKDDLIF